MLVEKSPCMMLVLFWYILYFLFAAHIYFKLKSDSPKPTRKDSDSINVSVVIPFRNESNNLPDLLKCIKKLKSSHQITWLFVNDHSTDGSDQLIENENDLHLWHLPPASQGKKQALIFGLEKVRGDVIVCIDADVSFNEQWLDRLISPIINKNSDWVIGAVDMKALQHSHLAIMQILEWKALQRLTHYFAHFHKPILCNGANLAFKTALKQEAIQALNNQQTSSGDDLSIMTRFNGLNAKACYVTGDASVTTSVPADLKSFVQQKIRWSKKMTIQRNLTSVVGLWFLLSQILLLVCCFTKSWNEILLIMGIKYFSDSLIIPEYQWRNAPYWLLLQIYPVILYIIQPFVSLTWKGRSIKS
jgi:biofilm PGA synthesis N-glycosyltransferase PgaC